MSLYNHLPTPSDWLMFVSFIRWLSIGVCLPGLVSCTVPSGPKSEIVVSVKDQRLGLYSDGVLQRQYAISTSKFGLGDQLGSYKTPLGKHEVIAKIGHGLPTGAVLKSRSWNGEVLKPNAPGRDPIVSRILWLRGMETDNSNAMKRFIYIHGTTEEGRLGKPASFGCIRMGMRDVVDLFNDVNIGAKVEITKNRLPKGADKLKPPAAIEPTDPAHIASGPPPLPKTADLDAAEVPKNIEAKMPAPDELPVKEEKPIVADAPATAEPKTTASAVGQNAISQAAGAAAPVIPAPVPVEQVSKRKRAGWFGLFSKKESAIPVEKPLAATIALPKSIPEYAATPTASSDGSLKTEKALSQATVAVDPPIATAVPAESMVLPATVEPVAPRKRSGFFGFFKRSAPVAPQAIAAVADENISQDRSDMNVSAQPVSLEGALPEKQQAGETKPN